MNSNKTPFATKVLDCFFLLRIALLAPVWTILLVGWIARDGRPLQTLWSVSAACPLGGPKCIWLALLGFSLIVAWIYVVNQIADIESDRINHKLFLLPHGYISIRLAWVLATACAASGLAISFAFDGAMTVLFVLSLALGYCYNLPPFQWKNKAWEGVLANFTGHGILTFLVGWHAGDFVAGQTAAPLVRGFLSALSPSMAIAAVFLATTIPDAEGDKLTNKKTVCIRYGAKKTAFAAALCCTAALLASPLMYHNFWVMAAPSAMSLAVFIALAVSADSRTAFHAFKWPVFLLTALVVVFVPPYGLLIFITFFGSRMYYGWRFKIEYPTFKTK